MTDPIERALERLGKLESDAFPAISSIQGRRAALVALRDAVLEEAAKATCKGCALGATTYVDEHDGRIGGTFHRTRAEHGFSADLSCGSLSIRALKSQPAEGKEPAKP